MDKDKPFDLHKGGVGNLRDEQAGHVEPYKLPKNPAITVRERADRTRGPVEFDDSAAHREHNFSSHLHKPAAAEAIAPRNPEEIESNEWRSFDVGKGGLNDLKEENVGGHRYHPPEEPNLNYHSGFGRK